MLKLYPEEKTSLRCFIVFLIRRCWFIPIWIYNNTHLTWKSTKQLLGFSGLLTFLISYLQNNVNKFTMKINISISLMDSDKIRKNTIKLKNKKSIWFKIKITHIQSAGQRKYCYSLLYYQNSTSIRGYNEDFSFSYLINIMHTFVKITFNNNIKICFIFKYISIQETFQVTFYFHFYSK